MFALGLNDFDDCSKEWVVRLNKGEPDIRNSFRWLVRKSLKFCTVPAYQFNKSLLYFPNVLLK